MKRTQRIDAQQNIRKQWVSFLSIIVIAAMAVTAFLGLNYSARAITKNSDRFYDSVRFRDAELISTLLLSPEDLDALRQTEGVADVEPLWQSAGTLSRDGLSKNAAVVSLTERINVPLLLSGRLPEAEDECVVDRELAAALSLSEGDRVQIEGAQYLRLDSFTVCGIALNADHSNVELSTPGDRNVVVLPSAFDLEALDSCAMKALLRYADCEGLSRFDKAYFSAADDVAARIKALAAERPALRTASIRDEYGQQIAEGEAELADAEAQLADARQQLDDGWAELEDGEKQAADARQQLADAEEQLADAEEQLADGKQQLADGRDQLQAVKAQLDAALQQLTDGQVELDDVLAVLDDARQQLDDGWAEYWDKEALLADAKALLDEGKQQLEDGKQQLDEAWQQLQDALQQLEEGEQEYAEGEAQLHEGMMQLYGGAMAISAARDELITGYDQIEDAKNTIRSGLRSIVDASLPEVSGQINWYSGSGSVDVDDPAANATDFPITDDFSIDLNLSLEEYIVYFLSYLRDLVEIADGDYDAAAAMIVSQAGSLGTAYDSLASGARAWDEGHAQYLGGVDSVSAGGAAYQHGLERLNEARKMLDDGWAQYQKGLADYESGAALLEEKTAEYEDGLAQYEEGTAQLAEGLEKLEAGEEEYAEGKAQYDEAKAQLDEGWEQYDNGKAQYDAAQAEYNAKYGEYEDGLAQYEDGLAQYEAGTQEYADALKALEEGRAELTDGEARYAEGMADYLQGALALSDAKAQLDGLDECRWVLLDVNGNASYQVIKADIQNISGLATTFALIFILVGALVIYATLGKIVEEQRRLVGATRALGFYKQEILAKYLVFGVGATVLGMLLGVAIGYFLIQPMLSGGYGQFFVFDNSRRAFSLPATLLVLAGGLVLSALAVVLACTDLLRSTATSLMQEKAPSAKQRKGRSGGRSLYARLILLNMRTDIKRVAVTVVSVAGCCTLLVTGFSMRSGVLRSLDYRFEDILRFDCTAYISAEAGEAAFSAAQSTLERAGASSVAVLTGSQLYSIDDQLSVNTLYCGDLEEMRSFLHCVEAKTREPVSAEADGIWICDKVSEVTGLKAGDSITLYNSSMRPFDAPVAGVFSDYMVRDMLMSPESYERIFGAPPENNALLVQSGSMETAALEELLDSLPDVERVKSNAQDRATMTDIAGVLNLVSLLLVGIAAIMAFFIILNLINMQVHQKKRELTIMRINGFTVRETVGYILRETVVTDVLGILLGLGAGMGLSYIILQLMEGVTARFVRTPQPMALVLAVVFTVGFSVILNYIALRKIKYLKLTDVA